MSTSGMHSGLFTLHFSPISHSESEEPPQLSTGVEKSTNNIKTSSDFGDWHVLLRFAVENEVLSVRRLAKIFVLSDDYASSGGNESENNNNNNNNSIIPGLGKIPRPLKDRYASVVMRCHCHWQYTEAFRFDVHFEELEASVLGLPAEFTHNNNNNNNKENNNKENNNKESNILRDVTVSCEGSQAYGWYIGEATVTIAGNIISLPHRLRFILNPYLGPQCTNCLEPVYALGYSCTECAAVEYCSHKCQSTHMSGGHGLLCQILRKNYNQRSGKVVTETEKGIELVAWWRCLEEACYSILVDYRNPLGQSIEFFLCTLKPAQEEGLRYRYIVKDGTTPKEIKQEELVEFACTVFRAVSENSISEGCTSLAAACLNYIFVFSRHIETIVESHVLYYYSYLCEDFEGTICSVEEYVTYARPMHELGVALIEFALKSPSALLFWQRIKLAKNVFINLYNVNTSCQCSGIKELVKAIPGQQRETLHLLSKLFLIMASRAPKEEGHRLLEQAEKCLRDCLPTEQETEEEAATTAEGVQSNNNNNNNNNNIKSEASRTLDDNLEEMEPSSLATLYYRLSALLLLYGEDKKTREAEALKKCGDDLIARTKLMQEGEAAVSQ